jgi:thiol-disulfide isomerase/thioredoxin
VIAVLLAAALAGEIDAASLRQRVEAHHGQPVVVTFWATWCAPCVKEFPELIALAARRRDVAFVSVSIDDKVDAEALERFVALRMPPFPVYRKADGKDSEFIDAVDPAWSGVVPATLVYGADGKRSAILQGEHTPAEIEKALEERAK